MKSAIEAFNYAWADESDLSDLKRFFLETFGKESIQMTPGRFEWLFQSNPFGCQLAICRHGGKIVAACGHLPQPVCLSGRQVVAAFGVDFMVSPAYRRKGIGKRILQMRLDRFDLSLSTGQSSQMHALYRCLGARVLGGFNTATFYRFPPLSGKPRTMLKGWAAWSKKLLHNTPCRVRLIRCGHNDAISGIRELAPDVDASQVAKDDPIDKTSWYEWRYSNTVYSDYSFRLVLAADCVVGVVALRGKSGMQVVTDVVTQPQDRVTVLRALGNQAPEPETQIMFAGAKLHHDLVQAGYLVRPEKVKLVGMSRDTQLLEQLAVHGLDLMAGTSDADLIRGVPQSHLQHGC